MSRKKTQPKKVVTPDPIFNSTIIPKLINSIMYDGKKVVAEKIVYEAIEKIKSKTKEEPINVVGVKTEDRNFTVLFEQGVDEYLVHVTPKGTEKRNVAKIDIATDYPKDQPVVMSAYARVK